MTSRPITKIYQDPLDLIWTNTAKQLGMKLTRSSEVFAAWDGKETLTIGSPEDLDADDSLAQMIFHEI
ncbi:MAG: YkgJ family cysteine cluster protein, partial [Deltaproteobacteria bacterium]|nr:YkgJ family cysteine cluster protein [Deltaproteobacteria bacterium]